MQENELKELIKHTLLLTPEAKEKLLSMSLEWAILQRVSAFFDEYRPLELAILSGMTPEILSAKKILQSEIEKKELLEIQKITEHDITSLLI